MATTSKPVIGFLNSQPPEAFVDQMAAFRAGLKQGGCGDRDVKVEYVWAHGKYDQLPDLCKDACGRSVDLLAVSGGTGTAQIAKKHTSTIPIVFVAGYDPVKAGLVASLNKPGANVTGIHLSTTELIAKRFDVLRELAPAAKKVALLVNPVTIVASVESGAVQKAAKAAGAQAYVVEASKKAELKAAFEKAASDGAQAILVSADPFFMSERAHIAKLAASSKLPTLFPLREYVAAGGLMSYGPSLTNAYRQAGIYSAMIIKGGANPAELPVLEIDSLEMVINLKAAKGLKFAVPSTLLARADEVIEA